MPLAALCKHLNLKCRNLYGKHILNLSPLDSNSAPVIRANFQIR